MSIWRSNKKLPYAPKNLIEHHIKYKEIHGEDVTTFMTRSWHKKLHNHLRKEDTYTIPQKELQKIYSAASQRTKKAKERNKLKYRERKRLKIKENRHINLSQPDKPAKNRADYFK